MNKYIEAQNKLNHELQDAEILLNDIGDKLRENDFDFDYYRALNEQYIKILGRYHKLKVNQEIIEAVNKVHEESVNKAYAASDIFDEILKIVNLQ